MSTTPKVPDQSTPPQQASPAPTPAPAPSPQVSNPANPVTQQQQPQSGTVSNPAVSAKAPSTSPAVDPSLTQSPTIHHTVAKASILNSAVRALVGNPMQTVVDANTGATTRVPAPLTTKQALLGIILESLGGAATGLAQSGPGATGRAAAAGFQQGEQQAQQRQQQAEQQASQDYIRRYSVLKNNLQLHALAIQNGRLDQEQNQAFVSSYAPLLKSYQDRDGIVASHLSADEAKNLNQYPATDFIRIVDGAIPRLDANGQPVYVTSGGRVVPEGTPNSHLATDYTFSIGKKDVQVPMGDASGNVFPTIQSAVQYGLRPQSWLHASPNATISGNQLAILQNEVSGLQSFQSDLKHFSAVTGTNAADLTSAVRSNPTLAKTVSTFIPILNATGAHYGTAIATLYKSNPQGANALVGLLGGPDAIRQFDQVQAAHDARAKLLSSNLTPNEANTILSDPNSTPAEKAQAKTFLGLSAQQAAKLAQAKKTATGKGAAGSGNGNGSTTGDTDSALVDQIGQGHVTAERMSYLIARNPALIAAVSKKYPDYDSSKAEAYPSTYKDYTSTKANSAGGTLIAGGTALNHLHELEQLNTAASHIPGTPAYTAYKNKVDTVASELARFYGHVTDQTVAGIKDTLESTLPGNRDAAIKTQAQSMIDRLKNYEQAWQNAAPSKYYEAPMPHISGWSMDDLRHFDPNFSWANPADGPSPATRQGHPTPPAGAKFKALGSDGKQHWLDQNHKDLGPISQMQPPSPQTHVFSRSAFAAANPGVPVGPHEQQAQQAGYQVVA